jgi:glutamate-ammonia-ligase adenylyltransferase
VLGALWPAVVEEFAAKHGAPPGRGAAVLGMGSLGRRGSTRSPIST